MVNEERLLQGFLELVQIDSESRNERAMADAVTEKLTALGYEVYEDDTSKVTGHNAGNILCRIKGNVEGADTILLATHLDTVTPGNNVKPVIKDGYVYSDGTTILGADDKAGVIAAIEVARLLKENNLPHGDIELLFTVGEEVSLIGAKALDPSLLQSKYGYALDTGGKVGNIKASAPARAEIHFDVFGETAHAGVAPEKGISAITLAAKAVANMPLGRIDAETTANIGVFEGTGVLNVVVDYAKVIGEARSFDNEVLEAQLDKMKQAFDDVVAEMGGRVEVKTEVSFPSFKLTDADYVVQIAQKAAANIGRPCEIFAAGGGSDANIFNGYGVPTVVLSCGYEEIHSNKERMPIEELNKLVEMTLAIVSEVAGK